MRIMINNDGNDNDLDRPNVFLNDIPSFLIIAFVVSLITAAIINTQPGMKSIADVLAFFALGYLIIGIAGQLISLRK
jgi:hypothetical protein